MHIYGLWDLPSFRKRYSPIGAHALRVSREFKKQLPLLCGLQRVQPTILPSQPFKFTNRLPPYLNTFNCILAISERKHSRPKKLQVRARSPCSISSFCGHRANSNEGGWVGNRSTNKGSRKKKHARFSSTRLAKIKFVLTCSGPWLISLVCNRTETNPLFFPQIQQGPSLLSFLRFATLAFVRRFNCQRIPCNTKSSSMPPVPEAVDHSIIDFQRYYLYATLLNVPTILFAYPLRTVRLLQQSKSSAPVSPSVLRVMREVLRKNGFKALYAGSAIYTTGLTTTKILQFATYDYTGQVIKQHKYFGYGFLRNQHLMSALLGSFSAVVTVFFIVPFNMVSKETVNWNGPVKEHL